MACSGTMARRARACGPIARPALAPCALVVGLLALLLGAAPAEAVPSYARQTGQECAACHNGFPELTPYGRLFKLNGYTFKGGTSDLPPVAAMVVGSYTNTASGQQGGAAPHYAANDNADFQFASVFYGGAIAPNLGAFAQVTYDNNARVLHWDNTDIRYARAISLLGGEAVIGVSFNNNPTVTDVWNSTPAWSYPFLNSELAPVPAGSGVPGTATLVEGALAQEVVGLNAYAYVNRFYYVELGAYRSLSPRTDEALGVGSMDFSIKGLAPYWRLAVEPKWGRNSFEIGTFGLAASLNPGRVTGFGTDHVTDVGFDAQYQFLADVHSVSVQTSWITENSTLSSTAGQSGGGVNTHDHLRTFRLKTSYWYDQTYGGTAGFFRIDGSNDANVYDGISANGSPNSQGYIGEVDYMPFSHGGPAVWPWLNLKLGVQYIYYTKFNGSADNYDGMGRNASDNNTLFLFTWLAF